MAGFCIVPRPQKPPFGVAALSHLVPSSNETSDRAGYCSQNVGPARPSPFDHIADGALLLAARVWLARLGRLNTVKLPPRASAEKMASPTFG